MVIGFELTLEAPEFKTISDFYIDDAALNFIYQNMYLFN